MDGEQIESVRKHYKVSRATLYNWIREAKEGVAERMRKQEIGPKGIERESRINKELEMRNLREENRILKDRLFKLMTKHNEWTA